MNIEIANLNLANCSAKPVSQNQETGKENYFYGLKPAECKMGSSCSEFNKDNLNDNQLKFYNKIQDSYSNGILKQETYDDAIALLKNRGSKFSMKKQFEINNLSKNQNISLKDKINKFFGNLFSNN